MTQTLFTVNSRKYDMSLRRSWSARLLEHSDTLVTLEGEFEQEVRHAELGVIERGTRSVETFILGRWYNYFIFFRPSGEFRNVYINISMPPVVTGCVVDYIDLDIDIIVWPDRSLEVLDMEEFYQNARIYDYPEDVVTKARSVATAIVEDPAKFATVTTK